MVSCCYPRHNSKLSVCPPQNLSPPRGIVIQRTFLCLSRLCNQRYIVFLWQLFSSCYRRHSFPSTRCGPSPSRRPAGLLFAAQFQPLISARIFLSPPFISGNRSTANAGKAKILPGCYPAHIFPRPTPPQKYFFQNFSVKLCCR